MQEVLIFVLLLAVIPSSKKAKFKSNDNLTNMHDSIYSSLLSFCTGVVSWAGETLLVKPLLV